jgi:hypothetical protein
MQLTGCGWKNTYRGEGIKMRTILSAAAFAAAMGACSSASAASPPVLPDAIYNGQTLSCSADGAFVGGCGNDVLTGPGSAFAESPDLRAASSIAAHGTPFPIFSVWADTEIPFFRPDPESSASARPGGGIQYFMESYDKADPTNIEDKISINMKAEILYNFNVPSLGVNFWGVTAESILQIQNVKDPTDSIFIFHQFDETSGDCVVDCSLGFDLKLDQDFAFRINTLYSVTMVLGFNVENGCEFCSVGADGFIDPIFTIVSPNPDITLLFSPGIGNIAAPVPEFSTWAMMLLGFAGLGYAGVKRASKITLA